jgi:hypothetical protein
MKTFSFTLIFLLPFYIYGQVNDFKRDNQWKIGYDCITGDTLQFGNSLIDFTTLQCNRSCPSIPFAFTCGNICDTSGNLALISNGYTITNRNGIPILGGEILGNDTTK